MKPILIFALISISHSWKPVQVQAHESDAKDIKKQQHSNSKASQKGFGKSSVASGPHSSKATAEGEFGQSVDTSFDNKESHLSLYKKQMRDSKGNYTDKMHHDSSLVAQKAKTSAKSLG